MRPINRSSLLAATAILGLAIAMPAQPAHAQNLFDMLFGGGVRRERREPPPAPAPRTIKKISAPSYYTYRADPLALVDFGPIVDAPRPAAFEPMLTGADFTSALSGLDGYELHAEKPIAAALQKHYAAHPHFIWVSGTSANGRAAQALRMLGEADSFGMDPADYLVAPPAAGFSMDDMPARYAELIRFEMALSARVLRYVRDAYAGRIDPNRLSGYHDFPEKPIDLAAALSALSRTQEVSAYLESRHPQNAEYGALRVELEALKAADADEEAITVDPKLLLKPGQSSAELPKLLVLIDRKADAAYREEFGALLETHAGSESYVQDLVPAIKAAQEAHGLQTDGVIGPRTVGALAGVSRADKIARVEIALEQLRWHPSDLGSPRVFINQPAFTASYLEGGEEKLSMRVVVGKTSNQTSFFYDEIERVEYNPYWGVPQSIIVNEMLPRLRGDPGYLDRAGYEVTDSRGRRIPSSAINWSQYGGKVPYNVRQTPSEANALGELKIMFPNKHAIYMHDTPSKSLFQRDTRAFSHGCVRLADPRGMAAAVLGKDVPHVAAKVAAGHSSENLARKIPVYVAYFTAWPQSDGSIGYFGDVYDRDSRVRKALEATAAVRAPTS